MVSPNEIQVEVNRKYKYAPPVNPIWLERLFGDLKSLSTSIDNFYSSITQVGPDREEIEIKFRDKESFLDYIKLHHSEIDSLWISLDLDMYSVWLRINTKEATINISVKSPSQEQCIKILNTVEEDNQLGFQLNTKDRVEKVSLKKRFAAPLPLKKWFTQFCTHIITIYNSPEHFNGWYIVNGDYFFGTRVRVPTWLEWEKSINQHWSFITEWEVTVEIEEQRITFSCDHRRGQINIEVDAFSLTDCEKILDEKEKALQLVQVQKNPYHYRKSAAIYKINDWSVKKFVSSTRKLIDELFEDHEPAIRDAYATKILSNNIEKLEGFTSINEFLTFIEGEDEKIFDRIDLSVEGVGNIALGIHIINKERKMEIRSNISPNELDEKVVKYYKEPLDLILIKGQVSGSSTSSSTETKEETWWKKNIVAIIGLLVTLLISQPLYGAMQSYFVRNELKVLSYPQLQATVNSPDVPLSWSLIPKDSPFRWQKADNLAPSTIVVLYKGDNTSSIYTNVSSPYIVHLEKGEGNYAIDIQPNDGSAPVRIEIVYTTKTNNTSPAPP